MPRKRNLRFPIGVYAKKTKLELEELCHEKIRAQTAVRTQQQQIRRLRDKESILREKADDLTNTIKTPPSSKGVRTTSSPTSLANSVPSPRTAQRRNEKTFRMAELIHGATKENKWPALDGLFDTLQKKCTTIELGDYVLTNKAVTNYVVKKKQREEKKIFEKSNENVLRSTNAYYSAGVMGKRKYTAVRLAISTAASKRKRGGRAGLKFMGHCTVPKLVPYNDLVKAVNSIDIGNVYSVQEFSTSGDEITSGCYRDLREYLPRLAKFYLTSNNTRKEALKWFGETEGTFQIAFGGDGCPFGKNETACSFLVSFLNTGKRVASSSDNFMVFGANCEETDTVVRNYVQAVYKQIIDIEGKVYEIDGLHVTFRFSEFPNDMKMLAMLGGELPNSATYFSSFANVSNKDSGDLNGTFGQEPDNKWQPWKYSDRIAVAKKVEDLKANLQSEKIKDKTKRSKITEFIAKQKSRQEFPPLLGKMINHAHVEPLHIKNNAWQYFFKALLKEALGKSKYPSSIKEFSEVPEDSCFARVVNALRYEVKASRLARKVAKWFDETQGKKSDLQYRFTGKESRLFCHNFMRLIKYLSLEEDSQKQRQTVLALTYIGIRLRDCCSLFNRYELQEADLVRLETLAKEYCHANKLFLPYPINPTIWTMGHVIPAHANDVFTKYKQGLLTVTMEGREAKHIALHRLSLNTSHKSRWENIFRHEFIMLIWLPEQGLEPCKYGQSKDVYIPPRVFTDEYCYCGLEKASPADSSCYFCGDKLMSLIHESIKDRKYQHGLVV